MQKSYVNEETLKVKIDIELGEVQNLIVSLEETEIETSPNSYRVKALITELKKLQTIRGRRSTSELRKIAREILKRGPFGALYFCPLRSRPAPRARDPAPRPALALHKRKDRAAGPQGRRAAGPQSLYIFLLVE